MEFAMVIRTGCALAGMAARAVAVLSSILQASEKEPLWQTDFDKAQTQAKAEKKLLLVDFTGSDWCGWCVRLKEEVFDKEEFQKEAPKLFVLVELDFPRTKELPNDLKAQNEKLAKQFNVDNFPAVLILDADAQLIARTGYRPGGPKPYVEHLGEFVTVHETIVQMRAKVEQVHGLARAQLLDQLIDAYAKLDNEIADIKQWSAEIIALDANNQAGLKIKYQFRSLLAEANELKQGQKFDEAKVLYDKALGLTGIGGEQKQEAHFAQGECFFYLKDFVGVVGSLKKAVEAAPESSKVANLQAMIQRFAPTAEAQETVARLSAQLEQAKGLNRAKLLDQMIDARTKLAQFVPDGEQAQSIEKWSREILTLDPDNQAGLKSKYEVQILLADSQKLLREKEFAHAHAALDKLLARPNLTPLQLQQARLTKGNCYHAQHDLKTSVDWLQKALEAAPDSPAAPSIKAQLRRVAENFADQEAKTKPQTPQKTETR
jgi:thioredoxin-related protein